MYGKCVLNKLNLLMGYNVKKKWLPWLEWFTQCS